MDVLYWIAIFIATFCIMEFNAWWMHKYVMHGFLWNLHEDHHHKQHDSWFEKNDFFFVFYAAISIGLKLVHSFYDIWWTLPLSAGILAYGIAYFIVHDVFIHQRFKWLRKANNKYAKGLRRAHKMHHKHLGKEDGENFGMLVVPFKYFK
ncbi:beta-carotene 3-hydroxylase [Nonlabens xylanidelens]|uniref:Beta-carotene 3-hydroxylase n=1 Tax=Nonlabens xylanidelens TaxID=191564 RepID=A0A2S6IFX3_9FLAO|nr:sterol desaturase family protein [Nonlabens xylanidelens]PPK93050.1 beta-carotene 3-hydroxylase [Nonlabens xylanidelens]PQJ18745.1 beta-carotene hydroxylase [Nonlabens xylanidelens]